MHPKDDVLRALTDTQLPEAAQLPEAEAERLREHLAGCPQCQTRLDELAGRAKGVYARLDALTPGPLEQPRSTQAAYQRFTNYSNLKKQQKEPIQTMFTRRSLWTALAIIAVLALVFTLTPANAWASSFLGLFRVQKVQVVTFDPAAVENAQNRLEANQAAIRQVFKDNLKVTGEGEAVKVGSVDEAASKAGFTPRLPESLSNPSLAVKGATQAVFTIDQPKLQELIDLAGVDVQLPKETDGKQVTANIPASVIASYGCPTGETDKSAVADCTALVQLPSPTVDTPAGLDMASLGEAMFRFLGVPAGQARQLSQRIDWTSTLVLPIPQGSQIQYEDVQVDGATGTLLLEGSQNTYALIWVKDGMLYGLHGPGGKSEALKVAGSLK